MIPLSVAMIVKNEQVNLPRSLQSVQWADELLVVDTGSTDGTISLAESLGARVLTQPWTGFSAAKQFAVDHVRNRWVLVLDADEEVTPELRDTIVDLLRDEPPCAGYRIHRLSRYLGRWILHGGWERDYTLRLFDRERGAFNHKPVHEAVEVRGRVGRIEAPLHHYTYPCLSDHLRKIDQYTELAARQAHQRGKTASIPLALLHGTGKLLTMYVLRRGFLDGLPGLVLAINSGFYVYMKYLKIWESNRDR